MSSPIIDTRNQASALPEHDKITALQGHNNTVGQFIEWLGQSGYTICLEREEREFNRYYPANVSIEKMLAAFFGIDLQKLEAEKLQILEQLRGPQ